MYVENDLNIAALRCICWSKVYLKNFDGFLKASQIQAAGKRIEEDLTRAICHRPAICDVPHGNLRLQ